jgi:two-component system, OmpR family, lantibiotic biosynthesis response regulator NisR/SpaR
MPKTILVVDDDQDLVRSMQTFLQARNYNVATASNGTEALAWLEKHSHPDLIVLDVMMDHDAEGFNVAFKLKADDATRNIPIVILSGFMSHLADKYASFEFIQARDWPAAKFFDKPVNLGALADSIHKLIAEAEALRQTMAEAG